MMHERSSIEAPPSPRPSARDVSLHHLLEEHGEVAAVQRHLIPSGLPAHPDYQFAVMYRPCLAAGGDYYGFQSFGDSQLGMVVADVSGHGTRAAVMMAVLRTALAAFKVFDRSRKDAPQDINAIVNDLAVPGIFVTAFFASLDLASGSVFCGNCGHPPAMIRRADASVVSFNGDSSLPIGIVPVIEPEMFTTQLQAGETLVLYTDGVTEARDRAGRFFGDQRLAEAIGHGGSASEIVSRIDAALALFQDGMPQADDQCVVVCARIGGASHASDGCAGDGT